MPHLRRTRRFLLIIMIVLAAVGAILMGDTFAAASMVGVNYFQ